MRVLAFAIAFLVTSIHVTAQDAAYQAQFAAFQKASGMEAAQRSALDLMLDMLEKDPNTDQDFLKRFRKVVLEQIGELDSELAAVYHKRFNLEELQEVTRFYETPVGHKLAKETPGLMEEAAKIGAAWGERLAMEVLEGKR